MRLINDSSEFVVAVDAGLCNLGVVVVNRSNLKVVFSGVFSTRKMDSRYVAESNKIRVERLADNLGAIIKKWGAKTVVCEMPHGGAKSARAILAMGLAFSMVVSVTAILGVKLEMVRPMDIKKMVNPKAKSVDKSAVIQYITRKYGAEFLLGNSKDEHICDAMGALDVWLAQVNSYV